MDNKIFKTQKSYIRYRTWRQRFTKILGIVSVILMLLCLVITNPYNLSAWLAFAGYILLVSISDFYEKRNFMKRDTEFARKETQARLARENKKRIRRQTHLSKRRP